MKLLIVESPGKVKKIQEFLGADWRVMASVGHVRDLPQKEMGVAAPDFTPQYVETERGKDVLAKLAAAVKKAETVYLATDPDREGEAIAWHLADTLHLTNPKRITYSEITEKAVKTALASPRDIDGNLVAAQEGRRVLDRLCGYMVSGPLSRAAGTQLSAGRVQSPAVRLVVEREREIRAFKVTTHFGVELTFEAVDNITDGWKATWNPWVSEGQQYFQDKTTAEHVAKLRKLEVTDCQESESRSVPPAPFTTSSLQQAASNALRFNPKKTMQLAQKLYEAGHITYMRTDSPNLSREAVEEIRAFCLSVDWPLVGPRTWKSKAGAQEAHEAIRPTHIEIENAGDSDDEKALYRLIRLRTLASQLEDAVFAVRTLLLEGDVSGKKTVFEAKGKTLVAPGWKVVTMQDQTDDPEAEPEPDNPVPALKPGTSIMAIEGAVLTKKTKPPTRFTEASLVKELEKRGIGRPSTYAAILDTITSRKYVTTEKRFLVPTALGEAVVDHLTGNFEFAEFVFTKDMEDALDAIAEGKKDYQTVMAEAHKQLEQELTIFRKKTLTPCPECGGDNLRHLVKKADRKDSRAWDFFACKDCESTFPNVDGKPGSRQEKREKQQQEVSEFTCRQCSKPLIRRQGTGKSGKPYDFYGCSGFPQCKQSYEAGATGAPVYEVQ